MGARSPTPAGCEGETETQPDGGVNEATVTQEVNGSARTQESRFMDVSCAPVLLLLKEQEQLRAPQMLKLTHGWSGSQVGAWTSGFRDRFLTLLSF